MKASTWFKWKHFLPLIFMFFIWSAFAQSVVAQTITGVVTDENDLPLPGVNVTILGTTIGTITTYQVRTRSMLATREPHSVFLL